ncbi:Tyr recombinase domain-containing protein [Vibrio crassostreae]|nr:Tyr recombinase domain-containing protein [Vibrio crassostreae]
MKTNVIIFSERNLKAEQAKDARTLRESGLPLRFRFHQNRQSGSWYVVRRDKWHLLGYWPVLTVSAVKKVLPEKLALLAVNGQSNLLHTEFESVGDVLTWYQGRIEKDAHRSKERKATIRSAIKCHLQPHLGELAIEALNRQTLDDALIWPLQENHSLASVKSVLSVLKQAFKQAEKLERIDHNPLAGVVFSDFITTQIQPKDGRLFANHIEPLFQALLGRDRVTQCLVVMLLAFGTRIGETLAAKWRDIDMNNRQWRLPMTDTKTGDWHVLPITDLLADWLFHYRTWQLEQGYRGVFLFPGHAHAKSLSYTTSRKHIQQVSEGQWSAHDCRKALKTICTDLGIDHSVSERLLNHAQSKMDKAYNQSLFMGPMRDALAQYHAWLDERGFNALRTETETRSSRSFNTAEFRECAA